MTLVTNSFDLITPNGTTLTQGSGGNTGTSGSELDVVSGACVSDNTYTHASSPEALTGTTSTIWYVGWTNATFTSVPGALYWRAYLYMSAYPGATVQLITVRTSSATDGFVNISTAGVLTLHSAGGVVFTSTALSTGAWNRLEGLVLGGTTGADGQIQLQIFSGANLETTTTSQDSTLLTGQNCGTTGTCNTVRYGSATAVAATQWLDDIGASTTGLLGPSGTSSSPNAGNAAGSTSSIQPASSLYINMTINGM